MAKPNAARSASSCSRRVWARAVGVVVAVLSALLNLGFLAAYPVWALIMITLDVVVIMALTVHGSDIRDF